MHYSLREKKSAACEGMLFYEFTLIVYAPRQLTFRKFNATVKWDVLLLDSYDWVEIPNKGSGAESLFGLYNSRLWRLILEEKFDAILWFAGYAKASFWIVYLDPRSSGSALLFGTDASRLASRIASR